MNSSQWAELLITIFVSLLTEYLKRTSQDQAQEVISKVSHIVATGEERPQFRLADIGKVLSFSQQPETAPVPSLSKEEYRSEQRRLLERKTTNLTPLGA